MNKNQKQLLLMGAIIFIIAGIYIINGLIKLNSTDSSEKYDKQIKEKAMAFLTKNNIKIKENEERYLTFTEMNYSFNNEKCYDVGGVSIKNEVGELIFETFYTCNKINSQAIEEQIINNQYNEKFLELKGDNPLVLKKDELYDEPGYISKNKDYKVTLTNNIENIPGIYFVNYNIKVGSSTYTVTRIILVVDETISNNDDGIIIIPTITLKGSQVVTLVKGTTYNEPGYTATDEVDGDITDKVKITGKVNTNIKGSYVLTYTVVNSEGQSSSVTRTVTIIEKETQQPISKPTIMLKGASVITLTQGEQYNELGYTATDEVDGNITNKVKVTGEVNTNIKGSYVLTYTVVNSEGQSSSVTRTITIIEKETQQPISKPAITLKGASVITLIKGTSYNEPGYIATDKVDGDITAKVKVTKNININVVGTYTVTYKVTNTQNMTDEIVRTIIIKEKTISKPIITLKGASVITLTQGEQYNELGYIATDEVDGNITNKVKVTKNININVVGTYTVTYKVANTQNMTDEIVRTVIVIAKSSQLDINISQNVTSYTNKSVKITLIITGDDYSHAILPNNVKKTSSKIEYDVSGNGNYTFTIYKKDGTSIVKTHTISNIDKTIPTGTCTGNISGNSTTVRVSAQDNLSGINRYIYSSGSNNSGNVNNSTYTFNTITNNVNVQIYDNAGNSTNISCSITGNTTEGNVEIHMIHVGKGDAILIKTPTKVIFVDGGKEEYENTVIQYIKKLGISRIDTLIGTHYHVDHIGNHAKFLNTFTVGDIYYYSDYFTCLKKGYCEKNKYYYQPILNYLTNNNRTNKVPTVGETITIGEVKLLITGPIEIVKDSVSGGQNRNSINFILSYGNFKMYFSGDAIQNENVYSRFNGNLKVDILKYPHHGWYNLPEKLVNELNPKYVLVPNGENYFNNESKKTREYLKNINSIICQTYKVGDIIVKTDGKDYSITNGNNVMECIK